MKRMERDFGADDFGRTRDEQLLENFLEIGREIRRVFDGKESQGRILIILRMRICVTQKEMVKMLHIQPGSVSEVLKKLENAGLILKVPNEVDSRLSDIVLTRMGRMEADRLIEQRRKLCKEMTACLLDEEKNNLFSMLERLQEDWKEHFPQCGSRHCCKKELKEKNKAKHLN